MKYLIIKYLKKILQLLYDYDVKGGPIGAAAGLKIGGLAAGVGGTAGIGRLLNLTLYVHLA